MADAVVSEAEVVHSDKKVKRCLCFSMILRIGKQQRCRCALSTTPTTPSDNHPKVMYVIGPNGSHLTATDLPTPGTRRWSARRKAEIVAAVRGGLISLEEACSRYKLTHAELSSWQELFDQHGLRGLRTKAIQRYRPGHRRRAWW